MDFWNGGFIRSLCFVKGPLLSMKNQKLVVFSIRLNGQSLSTAADKFKKRSMRRVVGYRDIQRASFNSMSMDFLASIFGITKVADGIPMAT